MGLRHWSAEQQKKNTHSSPTTRCQRSNETIVEHTKELIEQLPGNIMTIEGPFDNLSFTRTFSRVFSIWKDRLGYFSIIAFVVLVPLIALLITCMSTVLYWYLEMAYIPNFEPKHVTLVLVLLGLEYFLMLIASILGEGAAVAGVARMYVGQSPTVMESFKEAWSRKYALFMSVLIIGLFFFVLAVVFGIFVGAAAANPDNSATNILAVIVGLVIVVAGSYAALGVSMTYAAIITEGISSPMHAIGRSWELASGNRCYIFCTTFLLVLANQLVTRLLHVIFATGDQMDITFSVMGIVVGLLPFLVFFPLGVILRTVIYLNLRVRHESMNQEVLSNDLMRDGSPEFSTLTGGEGGVDGPLTSDLSSYKDSEDSMKMTNVTVATEVV